MKPALLIQTFAKMYFEVEKGKCFHFYNIYPFIHVSIIYLSIYTLLHAENGGRGAMKSSELVS